MFNPFPLRTGFCQSLTSLLKSRMGMQQACDFMYGGPHGYGIFTSTLLSHVISTNMPCIEIWDTYDILWLSPVWQWIYHDGICTGHIRALVSPCLQFDWHAFWSSFGVVSIFACMSLHDRRVGFIFLMFSSICTVNSDLSWQQDTHNFSHRQHSSGNHVHEDVCGSHFERSQGFFIKESADIIGVGSDGSHGPKWHTPVSGCLPVPRKGNTWHQAKVSTAARWVPARIS